MKFNELLKFDFSKQALKENARDILGITIGAVLCGMGYSLFLIPFKAAPGGVGGLSQILYYFFNIPVGWAMLFFNIPLFIVGVLTLGKGFGLKTVYAIVAVSIATDLSSYKFTSKIAGFNDFLVKIASTGEYALTTEIFLAVLAGSVILGAGIGLIIKSNGSTGGSDIPVLLLKKYMGISIGNGYLIVETAIIIFTGIMFKDGNLILWAWLSMFICAKITDMVVEGYSRTKGVMIVSQSPEKINKIKDYIIYDLDRGFTAFSASGGYGFAGHSPARDIIYVVVNRSELAKVKSSILKIDDTAFVIVNEVFETIGRGFKRGI